MKNQAFIDHLFRHQYGKMVSILTRIFGLHHLATIEDAVQDTFATATLKWRTTIPENPEAWLTKAAKNRMIDIFRKINADKSREEKIDYGTATIAIEPLFEQKAIDDSQLRMIFTACHPALNPKDQIAFALKTIGGFSQNEIAAALLLKPETVKKRLSRAKKTIVEKNINFTFPKSNELKERLDRVYEIIYLLFNEGFHSNHQKMLIRKELCGEALRLCKLLLSKEELRTGTSYALFALMCFHTARIETKIDENFESISLKNQDRTKWYFPLIQLGNEAMIKTVEYKEYSIYHIEAAIALEHLKAKRFEETDWGKILSLYNQLYKAEPNAIVSLSIATILLQLHKNDDALEILNTLKTQNLEQKTYLFYGVMAKYYKNIGQQQKAKDYLQKAIEKVGNEVEKKYLMKKRDQLN